MTKQIITSNQIAKKNDLLRELMISNSKNKVILSPIVANSSDRSEIITSVKNFNDFNHNNDPHKEHDFAVIKVNQEKYIWKIDYLDHNFLYGLDPYEEDVCRQLTIMHTSEY